MLPAIEVPPLELGEDLDWWSLHGVCLLGLSALFLLSLLRLGPRAFVAEVFANEDDDEHAHDHTHAGDSDKEHDHSCGCAHAHDHGAHEHHHQH